MGNGDRLYYNSADYNGRLIHELGDPVAETDAANKRYVDAKVSGGGGAAALGDLTDVDTEVRVPQAGDRLVYWADEAKWVPAPPSDRIVNLFPLGIAVADDPSLWTGTPGNYIVAVGDHPWTAPGGTRYGSMYLNASSWVSGNLYSPEVWPIDAIPVGGASQIAFSVHVMIPLAGGFNSMYKPTVDLTLEWLNAAGEAEDGGGRSEGIPAPNEWLRYSVVMPVPPGGTITHVRPKVKIMNLGYNQHRSVIAGLMINDGPLVPWVPKDAPKGLAALPDVAVDDPAEGMVLTYDGAHWVAAEPPAGGGAEVDWSDVPGAVSIRRNGYGAFLEMFDGNDKVFSFNSASLFQFGKYSPCSFQGLAAPGDPDSRISVKPALGFEKTGTLMWNANEPLQSWATGTTLANSAPGALTINNQKIVVEKAPGTEGQVLTTDADGVAVWADPPAALRAEVSAEVVALQEQVAALRDEVATLRARIG